MLSPSWGDHRLEQLVRTARLRCEKFARLMVTRPSVAHLREALFWQRRLAFLEKLR